MMTDRYVIETMCYRYGRAVETRLRAEPDSDEWVVADKTCEKLRFQLRTWGVMDEAGELEATYIHAYQKGRESVAEENP